MPEAWNRSARAALVMLAATAGVCLLAGCGEDNPGEPRGPLGRLLAPRGSTVDGGAHVYCVEQDAVPITPCSARFEITNDPPDAVLRTWWLRGVGTLQRSGTFSYDGDRWRFSDLTVERSDAGGERVYGWSCSGDAALPAKQLTAAFDARDPLLPGGIHTLAEAHRRGCDFGSYLFRGLE